MEGSVRRLLTGLVIAASGLALSACGSSGHSLEYQRGWNYALAFVEHASYLGPDVIMAEDTTCDQTARSKWPPVYGMIPQSKYPDYRQWVTGCYDAVSYVNGFGQKDVQSPLGPP